MPLREQYGVGHIPAESDSVSVTYGLLSSAMNIEIEMLATERAVWT
jgi:hypothetical protein